ncbi:hypothetical protein PsorP6_008466 [Peronosclerospora sorghi]|uniref:Uncharacterized protein n=1 Tax=Peronosclerospora sorghi TaxID=230839 RepID=A0ACC0WD71_9STRA|nr:hypothetical protein PsorP6_008466 [Peronosclerospora sorghi]
MMSSRRRFCEHLGMNDRIGLLLGYTSALRKQLIEHLKRRVAIIVSCQEPRFYEKRCFDGKCDEVKVKLVADLQELLDLVRSLIKAYVVLAQKKQFGKFREETVSKSCFK